MKLINILKKQTYLFLFSTFLKKWNNPFLRWNPDDYDGIKKILVDPNELWVPDIVLENK